MVVSSEGAELVSSREADWLKRLAAFLVVLVVYFAIEVGFGNFVVKDDVVEDIAGQKSVFPHCAYELIEFEYILFVIEGVVLVVALRVCWLTREVPDFLNDSHRSTAGASDLLCVLTELTPFSLQSLHSQRWLGSCPSQKRYLPSRFVLERRAFSQRLLSPYA